MIVKNLIKSGKELKTNGIVHLVTYLMGNSGLAPVVLVEVLLNCSLFSKTLTSVCVGYYTLCINLNNLISLNDFLRDYNVFKDLIKWLV